MRIDGRMIRFGLVVALAAFIVIATLISLRPDFASGGSAVSARASGQAAPVLVFDHADISFADASAIPATGWSRGTLPDFTLLSAARTHRSDPSGFWARVAFDRAPFGERALALNCDMIRDDFVVYLNGALLYRSRDGSGDGMFGWNHPLFVSLPPSMLRPGLNQIAFQVETSPPNLLGLGVIRIGPDAAIRSAADRQYFIGNVMPQIVSGYLLILTVGVLSFWARRPGDHVYGWLALVGVVWLFRNLHYFAQGSPVAPELFWQASTDSIFLVMTAVFAFATSYFALPRAALLRWTMFGLCGVEIVARHVLLAQGLSELPAFLLTIPISVLMVAAMLQACLASRRTDHWLMFAAIAAALVGGFHDMTYSFNIYNGAGFFLQPYGGLAIFLAFDIALTARLQDALVDVEDVNIKLEARVADVTATLERSEADRAKLHIASAVDRERERIMRDIHDGIGSSLVTALATARHRNDSPETIATLSRSLTDLRIGVDSLEPVGGDVVGLLASLRHRMERELKGAGVAFVWKVNRAPPLPWLDPIGALHILRIFQEAIGNALSHAGARTIEVRCDARDDDGRAGILIEIVDGGDGFDAEAVSPGNGLANMAARADAVGGTFSCRSEHGTGTVVALWLPLVRDAVPA
ncbi:MAG: hypothetical protein JWL96_2335 [Sphingomonas bacterium]|nr:hypothetical protein [Sphingomonas bacterium]